ncbi:pentapeptide repeat-containing protein [Streptomyces sp. CBG9]|uniref:pentapeptide repeat-containing protein n=1 Tax=Streptomyces sp. CBG9 TaxID=2762622 RepID=UPI001644E61E|nr:pentapeptide repeat-containing protein [Streptomyces sp. CBG9]
MPATTKPSADGAPRLWRIGSALTATSIGAAAAAGGVFLGLVALLGIQEIDTTTKLDASTLFELLKLSFGVVAGLGALVALVVAYRRQRLDEAGAHRDVTRLHTERFTTAVNQLGDASAAVRLGGVHALAGLADDAPTRALRQTCIDVLCAYLRLPHAPDPGTAAGAEHHHFLALREVRHTILRLLGDHYRIARGAPRSWQGCHLDLTGTTIDGLLDFHGAEFTEGTLSFARVTLARAGVMNFSDASFSGGVLDFERAHLAHGEVLFTNAEFCGATANFNRVNFAGSLAEFTGAVFLKNTVDFGRARFGGGHICFMRAQFCGASMDFEHAAFAGATVDFGEATFSGGAVRLRESVFVEGDLLFHGADFCGSEVSFDYATIVDATLHFGGTVFVGGRVASGSATFSGGEVSFDGIEGFAPEGLLAVLGRPVPAWVVLPNNWRESGGG